MRSNLRAASVALLLIAAPCLSASAQSPKLAYITSSVLLEQAPGRAAAESLFAREAQGYEVQIKRMSDSLDAMIQGFQKRQATLTAAQKETQGKEIQGREAGYQARTRELQAKANARQNELIQPILDRVKQAIEDVRIEGGYAFVFNADQGSPIVAMDKNLNITDRVLAKLRAQGTTAAAPKPSTGTPAPAPSGVTRPVTPPTE